MREQGFGIHLSQRGAFEAGRSLFLSPGSDFTEVHFRIIDYDLHYVYGLLSTRFRFPKFKNASKAWKINTHTCIHIS